MCAEGQLHPDRLVLSIKIMGDQPELLHIRHLLSDSYRLSTTKLSCNSPIQCQVLKYGVTHSFLPAGKYELGREGIEFSQYMREEGYHIIPIKAEHQLVCLCINVKLVYATVHLP